MRGEVAGGQAELLLQAGVQDTVVLSEHLGQDRHDPQPGGHVDDRIQLRHCRTSRTGRSRTTTAKANSAAPPASPYSKNMPGRPSPTPQIGRASGRERSTVCGYERM